MASAHRRAPGRIITFYSYKGGTGRTMALANVACLLAEGARVLVVDWDLEAPGLHRFFPPRLRPSSTDLDLGLDDGPGLIDLFERLRDRLPASAPTSESEAEEAATKAFADVPVEAYVRDTTVPNVRILRAGRNDDGQYSRRVGTFDWEGLFKRAPGIYHALAERLAGAYDYVLIDSRTGVTDISGICTYLLPEQLVVVFTPNRQSLTGVRELVERATNYRRNSNDLRPLLVFPLPSRIEASLQDLRTRWRLGDAERNVIGYQPMFQDLLAKCYGLDGCDLASYFDDVQIQQTPDYAYGEEIAVRRSGDRFSMANSYSVFVRRLTSGEPPWSLQAAAPAPAAAPAEPAEVAELVEPESSSKSRAEEIGETFRRGLGRPIPAPPRAVFRKKVSSERVAWSGSPSAQVFLSFASADTPRVAHVQSALIERGLRVTSITGSGDLGTSFSEKITSALDASSAVVVFWSRESIESPWVRTAAEEGLRRGILVPVLLDDIAPPLGFRNVTAVDMSRGSTDDTLKTLGDAVHQIATATPGTVILPVPAPAGPPPAKPEATVVVPTDAPASASVRHRLPQYLAAAVLALAFAGTWFYTQTESGSSTQPSTGAQTVTVPNFVGESSADVVKTAELIGLTVSMSDGRGTQGALLDGVVTSQTPAAGTSVAKLSRVELQIATRTVTVPTLVGTTLDSALPALERSGLRLGKTTTQPVADAKPGTIVRQTPEAGASVAAGAAVDVVVAAQPADVTVPNVIGKSTSDAETTLRNAGLVPSFVRGQSPTVSGLRRYPGVDFIVIQDPVAGTRVKLKTKVSLVARRSGESLRP